MTRYSEAVHKVMMLRGVLRPSAVFILYAALVCWLTWPLAAHIVSHRPATFPGSDFDPLYSAWVLAWESHTLSRGSLDIADANIYHPAPDALFYGPAALGALPYFAPVYLLSGNPVLALNLLFLGSIALTAAALHLVVRAWTGMDTAGLIAGVAYLANRWLLWTFVPTVPHLAVLFYFPAIVFLAAAPQLGLWRTLLLLLLVVLQCSTDPVYVAPAVLLPLAILAVFYLAREQTRTRGLRLLAVAAAAGLAVLVIHAPYLSVAAQNPELRLQTNWLFDPAKSVLELPWGLMGFMSPLAIASLVPALIAAVGALVLLRRWRGAPAEASAWRHTMLWVGVGIAISLPMQVSWGGEAYTLPHLAHAQAWLPFPDAFRLPERLRVAALIGVALLAGLAFAELARHAGLGNGRTGKRRLLRAAVALALCAGIYVQYAYAVGQPAPYGPAFPTAYRLGEAPRGDSPVLRALRESGGPTIEVPVPPRAPTKPAVHATAMYRSIFHWQPLLNGYSSYWPAGFAARMQTAARLPDPAAVRRLQREAGLAFILVRAGAQLPADARLARQHRAWLDLARRGGRRDLKLVAADDELLLFRVTDPAKGG